MRRMLGILLTPFAVPARHHFWGAALIVAFSGWVMDTQLGHRWSFAGAELKREVMDRWGAPIDQAAPSARYVESGAVFGTLETLPFDSQRLNVVTEMRYRKRGLVYFSGFEFAFEGRYAITNVLAKPVDAVFVFPIQADRNRILLSDLAFRVDGEPEPIPLHAQRDKLVWTGRVAPHASVTFEIRFRGQGLDRFRYVLDPGIGARDVDLTIDVTGGETYDYPAGVVPAHQVAIDDDRVRLAWRFDALESGVPIGLVLPSETSFDAVIATMARRSLATFALFFAVLVLLARLAGHRVTRFDAYFVAALYAFFFVLLPYLAAYMTFFAAYALSTGIVGALLHASVRRTTGTTHAASVALIAGLLVIPTAAVISEEHTGLVYCLEILAALVALSVLMRRSRFRELLDDVSAAPAMQGDQPHEA